MPQSRVLRRTEVCIPRQPNKSDGRNEKNWVHNHSFYLHRIYAPAPSTRADADLTHRKSLSYPRTGGRGRRRDREFQGVPAFGNWNLKVAIENFPPNRGARDKCPELTPRTFHSARSGSTYRTFLRIRVVLCWVLSLVDHIFRTRLPPSANTNKVNVSMSDISRFCRSIL